MWKKLDPPQTSCSSCWFPLKIYFFLSSLYFLSFLRQKLDKEGFSRPISKCWNCFKGSLMDNYEHNSEFLTENLNSTRKVSISSNLLLPISLSEYYWFSFQPKLFKHTHTSTTTSLRAQSDTYANSLLWMTTKTTSKDSQSSSEVTSLPQVLPWPMVGQKQHCVFILLTASSLNYAWHHPCSSSDAILQLCLLLSSRLPVKLGLALNFQ